MLSFICTLITLSLVLTLVHGQGFELKKTVQLVARMYPESSESGVVYGAQSCGGEGKYINTRIDVCNTTDSLCQFPADGKIRAFEITFIPTQSANQLGIRVMQSVNGRPKPVQDGTLQNNAVQADIEQTVFLYGYIAQKYKGSKFAFQITLSRVTDKAIETCVDFELDAV